MRGFDSRHNQGTEAINLAHRLPIRFMLVPVLVWTGWLGLMFAGDHWHLFFDYWFMSVTMCIGSFVAGATSEGGGAVAFPAMTLLFNIPPPVARDFCLMIQSVGMSAAAVFICLTRIRVEWRAVIYAGMGGIMGIVVGLELLSPLLPAPYLKMFFVSLWLSFALVLFRINRQRDRKVKPRIDDFNSRHALVLIGVGGLGGMVSGVTGSGLDILTFTLLTLCFRISEKVATPTSVVLMATSSVFGFVWRGAIHPGLASQAWNYWLVCVPVVVVGAPLGAYFISRRTRHFVSRLLYASIVMQFVGALLIVPQTSPLVAFSAATFATGTALFALMTAAGTRRLAAEREDEAFLSGRPIPKVS